MKIEFKTTNLKRLQFELSGKDYFSDEQKTTEVYTSVLEENNLDPFVEYDKANDRVNMLESVYTILNMLANNVEAYIKVETEFATTSAAYQYLQKRLKDLRDEIDRVKLDTHYTDNSGNTSSVTSYLFFNGKE